MRALWYHPKIWLCWTRWWAVQLVTNEWLALGVHIDPHRPCLDLFLGPLTVSVGNHPIRTDDRAKHRYSGRGFLYEGDPLL